MPHAEVSNEILESGLKLERTMMPKRQYRIAVRFEGSTRLSKPEPKIDEYTKVITVSFVKAKDGRPANPEDLIRE